MLKNRWLGLFLALVLAVSTACGSQDEGQESSSSESESSSESSGSSESAEPVEVPDVPDVVAEVNGEEISQDEFAEAYETRSQQLAGQAAQGGQQPDEEQLTDEVVQSLVNEELLRQEAQRREIDPSEEQVEQTLTELAQQNGLESADAFITALEDQGLSREEIESQAMQQTTFDLLVEQESGSVEASDQEIRALYQQVKQQQQAAGGEGGQELPPLDQVRPQLVQQIETQKTQEAGRSLIDQLRQDGDVTVNV